MVGVPPPKVLLPTRKKEDTRRPRLGALPGTFSLPPFGWSVFGCDAKGLHLAIEMTAFQPQQLGGPRHVSASVVQLAKNVIALGRFANLLQTSKAIHTGIAAIAARRIERNMAQTNLRLWVHDHDALHHIAQLAHVARPGIRFESLQGF